MISFLRSLILLVSEDSAQHPAACVRCFIAILTCYRHIQLSSGPEATILDWHSHDDEYPCTRWGNAPTEKLGALSFDPKYFILVLLVVTAASELEAIEPSCLK